MYTDCTNCVDVDISKYKNETTERNGATRSKLKPLAEPMQFVLVEISGLKEGNLGLSN